MFEHVIKDPRVRQEIEAAGFKGSLDRLAAKLHSHGYAEATVTYYGQAAVHFALWLVRQQVDPSQVHEGHVARFLSRHLPGCRCPLGGIRQNPTVRVALRHFGAVLGGGDLLSSRREGKPDAVDLEVQRFDDYLRTACGLQEATRACRRRYVREFLQEFFADDAVNVSRLSPRHVTRYVSKRASRLKPGSAKVVASSLRSYFRFLQLHGRGDEALLLAVPAPASYRLASLPRVLTDEEVVRLLTAFDRGSGAGRRDYAMTRCLTDLALRAEEIARLRLEDIDWRKGTVRIVGAKARRDEELPLTDCIGAAIAGYLRQGRPETSEREVFVRLRPPVGQPVTRRIVCNAVLRAAARAGIGSIVNGTRILRHTAATRMLRQGVSMKEIADILRHRCLDTTAIYAKVDVARLATVGAPWPGGEDL